MSCSICRSLNRAAIVEHYAMSYSLRKTAEHYNVGFRSLHRHIHECLKLIFAEYEQECYQKELAECVDLLRQYYLYKNRKLRPKSIITKKVTCNWGRKAWKKGKTGGEGRA